MKKPRGILDNAFIYLILKKHSPEKASEYAEYAVKRILTHPYKDSDTCAILYGRGPGWGGVLDEVAIGYDWLYDYLDEPRKAQIKKMIIDFCESMKVQTRPRQCLNTGFIHNYQLRAMTALGMGAISLYGEDKRAEEYFDMVWVRWLDT